jgi:hypothetical protein
MEVKVDNPDERKARPDDFKLLQFFFMKAVKSGKGFYGEHYAKTLPRFDLVDVDLTILELKRRIFTQIKHIFKADSPLLSEGSDAELNRCIVLHVFDNLPYYNEGKYYTKKKATCEFCRSLHGQADTCDIQVHLNVTSVCLPVKRSAELACRLLLSVVFPFVIVG